MLNLPNGAPIASRKSIQTATSAGTVTTAFTRMILPANSSKVYKRRRNKKGTLRPPPIGDSMVSVNYSSPKLLENAPEMIVE
ncbi:hypothetical protein U1Q18_026412 [Sarracenia purpurea var. burkii]